jgi:hypothetical protein
MNTESGSIGSPSWEILRQSEPWGWQIDGHHLIINYFVLGDQVVMSPVFIGSEPVRAVSGKFKGTVVMQDEQDKGLAFMRSLDEAAYSRKRFSVRSKSKTMQLPKPIETTLISSMQAVNVATELSEASKGFACLK